MSVLLHPEWHPADRVASYERDFEGGLARSQHIITISENSRQEIIRHLGVPGDRVSRTYMGTRPGLRPMPAEELEAKRRALDLPANYLLYMGTIEPRKNLMTLLRAYCALPAAVREEYPLVLVGGWGWNSADVAQFLQDEARHRGVRYLGYVDEGHINTLYNGARALVFPSHYEGFGMPTIEMMACGGAVLASTAGAIAETVGNQAHLTHADDLDGWRQAPAARLHGQGLVARPAPGGRGRRSKVHLGAVRPRHARGLRPRPVRTPVAAGSGPRDDGVGATAPSLPRKQSGDSRRSPKDVDCGENRRFVFGSRVRVVAPGLLPVVKPLLSHRRGDERRRPGPRRTTRASEFTKNFFSTGSSRSERPTIGRSVVIICRLTRVTIAIHSSR